MEKKKRERRDGVWKDPQSGVWRYRFMHKSRRYFGTVPEAKNKTEARAARDRRRIAVREGREDKAEASAKFETFVKQTFLPWVQMNRAAKTYQSYTWRANNLVKALGELDVSKVSTFAVEKFKREEVKRKTNRGKSSTPGTVNACLLVLGSILSLAEELGMIKKEERPKITLLKGENKRLRYLSADEERRLLAAAAGRPHLQDLIVVALATGLRREELFSLRKDDVDLRLNLVNVMDGKGGKFRAVPLDPSSAAYSVLARRREGKSEWVFATPWSRSKKMAGVDVSLKTACAAAKLEGVTLHALRHTFGTRLVASGVDLRTVQELMGHSEIKTTMIYAHVVEGNKHAAIARLNEYRENCHEITTGNVVELDARRA